MNTPASQKPKETRGSFLKRTKTTAFARALALNHFRAENDASGCGSSSSPKYELVYSGTPNPKNAGKIDLRNTDSNTRLILDVRCGRATPKKGDGAVSANVTDNGVNTIRGTSAPPSGTSVLVSGMTVTLNRDTGIVTTDGKNGNNSWGTASYGVTVNMTVSGSGTSSVNITYVITGNLTGGAAGPLNSMPNPVRIEFIYTADKVK